MRNEKKEEIAKNQNLFMRVVNKDVEIKKTYQ